MSRPRGFLDGVVDQVRLMTGDLWWFIENIGPGYGAGRFCGVVGFALGLLGVFMAAAYFVLKAAGRLR
jgi:hypothetical protein